MGLQLGGLKRANENGQCENGQCEKGQWIMRTMDNVPNGVKSVYVRNGMQNFAPFGPRGGRLQKGQRASKRREAWRAIGLKVLK